MGRQIKITVIGNSAVGKTCLLISYATNSFPTEYVPTVFDNYNAKAVIEGNPVELVLFDTAGDSEYDTVRPMNYPGTDVFLICFCIVAPATAERVLKNWNEEVRAKVQEPHIILVGTKSDLKADPHTIQSLKNDTGLAPVSKEQGDQLAEAIGAHKYIECSALKGQGVREVFEEACKVVLFTKPIPKPNKDKKCLLM